jgi:hypothetical protein
MALLLCLVAWGARATAQTVNPTKVAFTASPDHSILVNNVAVLDSYQFDTMVGTASGALAFSTNLGKPTPASSGCPANVPAPCIVAPVSNLSALTNGVYVGVITAIGPGGATKAPAVPFSRMTGPAAVTAVALLP